MSLSSLRVSHASNKFHDASFILQKTYFEISAEPIVSAIKNESKELRCQSFSFNYEFSKKTKRSPKTFSIKWERESSSAEIRWSSHSDVLYINIQHWNSLSLTNSYLAPSISSPTTWDWNKVDLREHIWSVNRLKSALSHVPAKTSQEH